ncbi:hypothetical protein PR048_027713, partial [Dryococelus australis]
MKDVKTSIFFYELQREVAMCRVRASDVGNEIIQHSALKCRGNFKATHVQKSCVQASYEVCAIMAKNQMSSRSGEIVKQCAIKMAKYFGDGKLAENFETVSLSHQTVSRTSEISKRLDENKYFSVALDESTDMTEVCQLIIIVKTVEEQLSIKEELFDLVPLPTSAKGSDIYSGLVSVVEKCGGFSKCSCIVTDSAKCMPGKYTGLVGLLRKNYVDVPVLHCIIHQEVLS